MSTPVVKVHRLPHGEDLPLPQRLSAGSAGVDLMAAIEGDLMLPPLARQLVPTGFALEIPLGWEGQVRPRSGLALKSGITVVNAPGTIDSDYRGEIGVALINLGGDTFTLHRGDRIAQLVIAPVAEAQFEEAPNLTETGRGSGGFGSTGIR